MLKNILLLFISFLLIAPAILFAESLTITTYYPSPYGSYNELYVTSKLGIGTTSPYLIAGASETYLDVRSSGNYGFIEVGKTATNTSGDVGYLEFMNGNNVRLATVVGGADSANNAGYLRISTATGGSFTERMRINSSGNVGIGTTDPGSYKLYVAGTIYTSGGCASCSDARWKKNIAPINEPLALVSKLKGVRFNWRDDEYPNMFFGKGNDVGLLAQDAEKVMPELVYEVDGYKYLKYERLVPLLIEAVKAQQNEIEGLKQEIQSLKKER